MFYALSDGTLGMAWRALLALPTAFIVSALAGAWLIRFFHRRQVIEDTTQPDHAGLNAVQSLKKNVPTMGGLMILTGIAAAMLLWMDLHSAQNWIALMVLLTLGGTGFVDDYIKLMKKPSRGLNKKQKLIVQFILGGFAGWLLIRTSPGGGVTGISLPLLGWWELGTAGYIFWCALVMAATSNAVNLTDGLDGLAGGCSVIAFIAMAAVAFVSSIVPQEAALTAVIAVGATLGFLWYNCHPARIFMGDTGSLALGGLMAYIALAAKLDLLLFVIGAVFFIDELTVALQIIGYKLTRKRLFPIAPIHHYFQVHRKWPEQTIVARAWIVACLAGFISFGLLLWGMR